MPRNFLLALWPLLCFGATLIVGPQGVDQGSCSTPCQTLSYAVQVATAGDTIQIQSGTYTGLENTDITISKDLKLVGSSATLDGSYSTPLFTITNGVSLQIEGLVLTNGFSMEEGGIVLVSNGSLSAIDSTFQNSASSLSGGAVSVASAGSASFLRCDFLNNTALNVGGAIVAHSSKISLKNSNLRQNTAGQGGAIYLNYAVGQFDEVELSQNRASDTTGGSISVYNGVLNASALAVTQSSSRTHGGGVWVYGSVAAFICQTCLFTNNSAGQNGAGLYFYDSSLGKLFDPIISGNTAAGWGGGICARASTNVQLEAGQIDSNQATEGGAVYLSDRARFDLTATGLFGNTAVTGADVFCSSSYVTLENYPVTADTVYCSLSPAHTYCSVAVDSDYVNVLSDHCGEQSYSTTDIPYYLTPLALTALVMLIVAALALGVCLICFVKWRRMSQREVERRDLLGYGVQDEGKGLLEE